MSKTDEFFSILLNSDGPEFEQIQEHLDAGNFIQAREALREFLTPTEREFDEILAKIGQLDRLTIQEKP